MGRSRSKGYKYRKTKTPLFKSDDCNCYYCKESFSNENKKTRDHLYPKQLGGKLSKMNKLFACYDCNREKGNKTLIQFHEHLINKVEQEPKNSKWHTVLSTVTFMTGVIELRNEGHKHMKENEFIVKKSTNGKN